MVITCYIQPRGDEEPSICSGCHHPEEECLCDEGADLCENCGEPWDVCQSECS